MDAGVVWTALGTVAAYVALALTWGQMRSRTRPAPNCSHKESMMETTGIPVLAPTGQLPMEVRGRDQLLAELQRSLRRPSGHSIILVGMGGAGKSTVAASFAERAQRARISWRRPLVWWVAAGDQASLTSALATVARQLGAGREDIEAIGAGTIDAPDRLWSLFEAVRHRRWLLIFDNADDPSVLARPMRALASGDALSNVGSVADGTGWLRSAKRGMVLVTSRNSSPATWGRNSRVLPVGQLGEDDAARVLLDCAPRAGDDVEARRLASRLGCLPLALRVVGSYLGSDVAFRRSFRDYRLELDDRSVRSRLLTSTPGIDSEVSMRAIVMYTWEISLDALARAGVAHARPLLRLLSCYASGTPIPLELFSPQLLVCLLAQGDGAGKPLAGWDAEHRLEHGLHQLKLLCLIGVRDTQSFGGADSNRCGVVVHPVIADASRAHLLDETTEDVNAAMVRQAAIRLVVDAIGRLDFSRSADWSNFVMLGPHLHALFDTVAPHVDRANLHNLVTAAIEAARAHNECGALPAAERLLREVLDVSHLLDEDDLSSLAARQELAWSIAIQGQLEESEAMYCGVLTARRPILGDEHPETLRTRHELAWVAAGQGRWAEAEAAYRDVLDARQRVLGEEDPDTLTTHHELAWTIANQDREEEAELILLEVAAVRRHVLGEDHPNTLVTRHELAWVAASQGRWAEAEAAYRDVLDARQRVLGGVHHHTLTTHHELAWTMAMQGKRATAIREYQEVLDVRRHVLGERHPETIESRESLKRLRSGQLTRPRHLA
jgi:tetratricopeptide (TPR) repeat protein